MISWSIFPKTYFCFRFLFRFRFKISLCSTLSCILTKGWKRQFFVHVNQCIYGRCDSWSRKFWEFDRPIIIKDRYHLRNTSLFHVSLLTWYREYLNTLLVLLSLKKTRRYRIISMINTHWTHRHMMLSMINTHWTHRHIMLSMINTH